MDACVVQCPREGCDNAQASFYQVQIRSADEPMTTFYKVRLILWLTCSNSASANEEEGRSVQS